MPIYRIKRIRPTGLQHLKVSVKARKRLDCTVMQYETLISAWKKTLPQMKVQCKSYEYDKQGRLHVHGLLCLPSTVPYICFHKEGFHVCVQPIRTQRSIDEWIEYCNKEQDILYDVPHDDYPKISHSLF